MTRFFSGLLLVAMAASAVSSRHLNAAMPTGEAITIDDVSWVSVDNNGGRHLVIEGGYDNPNEAPALEPLAVRIYYWNPDDPEVIAVKVLTADQFEDGWYSGEITVPAGWDRVEFYVDAVWMGDFGVRIAASGSRQYSFEN